MKEVMCVFLWLQQCSLTQYLNMVQSVSLDSFYSSIILDLDLYLAPTCELERYRNWQTVLICLI
jgi:hypothetical protein